MIEPTAEMIALFDGLTDVDVYAGDTVPAILRDLLAIIERDQAPTREGVACYRSGRESSSNDVQCGSCDAGLPMACICGIEE